MVISEGHVQTPAAISRDRVGSQTIYVYRRKLWGRRGWWAYSAAAEACPPGQKGSSCDSPSLIPCLVTSAWIWPRAAPVGEPVLGDASAASSAISMVQGTSVAPGLAAASRNLRWLQRALEGVRNALQTNFLSVIVLNSLLAIPASQVSVCFKLFSLEASTAFFQIESHLFSTQVSNLSGALCIISQSALPCTIYPNLVSSVNYISMPFSSSCI